MSTTLKEINDLHQSELYLYFYADSLTKERTKKEGEFIEKHCNIRSNHKLLDLACGHGRHSNFFAKKGYNICGIDINKRFIQIAKDTAKKENLTVEYLEGNILEIAYKEEFDAVLLLFNTLGFFDKEDCKKLIGKIYSSLKIGGKVFLDTKNRDHIIKELAPYNIIEREKNLMIDRMSFDPVNGTTTNERIYIKDGKRYDTPFTMYLYNYSQLEELINKFDFRINKVFGGWSGEVFNSESRRIILVMERIN